MSDIQKEIEDMKKEQNQRFTQFYVEYLADIFSSHDFEVFKPQWSDTILVEVGKRKHSKTDSFILVPLVTAEIYYVERHKALRFRVDSSNTMYSYYTNDVDEILGLFDGNNSIDKIRLLKSLLGQLVRRVCARKI